MSILQGVHHIAVKPTAQQYQKTVEFYTGLLGMEVKTKWGDEAQPCMMVSCGDNTCMEILGSDAPIPAGGPLAHIAFATDKVDDIIEKVRAAGYPITVEPKDANLGGVDIRIAFCVGPTGEEVEFFWEKK